MLKLVGTHGMHAIVIVIKHQGRLRHGGPVDPLFRTCNASGLTASEFTWACNRGQILICER